MGEILVSPDVVALAIGWLRSELPTIPDQNVVPVHRAVPDPRPPAFITCRLAPGSGIDPELRVVDVVQLNFEAWAPTVAAAQDLAQNARAVMLAAKGVAVSGVQVYRAEDFAGPAELPDPLSNVPRFVFSIQLSIRVRAVRPTILVHVSAPGGLDAPPTFDPPEILDLFAGVASTPPQAAPWDSLDQGPEGLTFVPITGGVEDFPLGEVGGVLKLTGLTGYPDFAMYYATLWDGTEETPPTFHGFWLHPTSSLEGPASWRTSGWFLLS